MSGSGFFFDFALLSASNLFAREDMVLCDDEVALAVDADRKPDETSE